jgi:hypothetical protein
LAIRLLFSDSEDINNLLYFLFMRNQHVMEDGKKEYVCGVFNYTSIPAASNSTRKSFFQLPSNGK